MSCKTLQGKYAERLEAEKFIMNDRINELYNKLDAQEDMLKQQIEIISKYEKQRKEAIEYIKENEFYLDYKTGACIKGVMPLLEILGGERNE